MTLLHVLGFRADLEFLEGVGGWGEEGLKHYATVPCCTHYPQMVVGFAVSLRNVPSAQKKNKSHLALHREVGFINSQEAHSSGPSILISIETPLTVPCNICRKQRLSLL